VFAETTLDDAAGQSWDVIIAGSSFAAMFFLLGLPPGLKVLVVEKGPLRDHEDVLKNGLTPEVFQMTNLSGKPKEWVAHSQFGGNSNCWWGQVPRFHPNDFRLSSLYGVGQDWPLGYADLEPYYSEVEAVMEVAGGARDHLFARSQPYPLPPHQGTRSDLALWAADPQNWMPVAAARASEGGTRPGCCANGVCSRCPVDAKFTILNGMARFERPDVTLLSGVEVRAVDMAAGRADAVVVRDGTGAERHIRAGMVALGTNAIFNVAILLRSGLSHAALGRYLHEQAAIDLELDVAQSNYFGGTSITGHGYGFYDGAHRASAGAVLIENFNSPSSLRLEKGRWTDRLKLKLIAEDLPQAENRVELDESGQIAITWMGHAPYAYAGIERAVAGLSEALPFAIEKLVARRDVVTEAHIQGTHRMGTDPEASVTDDLHRVHGVDNLLALGAGAFPTCSPANPTLTLSALALRAGRAVA
jgi:choline dehydrogenase-like flavoprotein